MPQRIWPINTLVPMTMKMPGLQRKEHAATPPPRNSPPNAAPSFPPETEAFPSF